MKKKIFFDTNTILSGTFFKGNEAKLLALVDIDLYTCDLVIKETREVARRKFLKFGIENVRFALLELERSFLDFKILQHRNYASFLPKATAVIKHEKDSIILAAALAVNPDYFVTGDQHFFCQEVLDIINVCKTTKVLQALNF